MTNPIIPLYKQLNKLIIKSKGCFLYDSDGKEYLDFESGDWATNIGHSNERINQAIKNQVDILIHDGLRFRNKPSEDLSIGLLEKLNFTNGKSVFLNSGSEAVNLGISVAKNITGRNKILKMDCSYLSSFGHGQISPTNANLVNIPMDDMDSISGIDYKEIAAFVFEPGSAWGLVKYPKSEFIETVANEVVKSGGLLMANEVTSGFGRTGKWFGFQHYNYTPDIVSTGKALGNGYPISCVSINERVSELFNKTPFRYAQSHQNDPLGCAVGLEVIKVFDDEKIVQQSFEKGLYFSEQLKKLHETYPDKIREVRARGLMLALEFFPCVNAEAVNMQLIDEGFLAGCKENVLRFMPPLIVKDHHIDSLINTIEKILKSIF
jgi:acetylornithine/N-succinyldiaminopimelate aminotransferase